jgi:gluconolactonase
MEMTTVTDGLRFPEGPVWMLDGSVIVVEIEAGRITRVRPDGAKETVAEPGGGPNGAAIGPDGKLYVCNNGGFGWIREGGLLIPHNTAPDYSGGRIERVDIATGKVEVLYDSCDGFGLRGPNDIVFDSHGGFYFTDLGKGRDRDSDHGGVYYGRADGSKVMTVAYPLDNANGVGLSPDGRTLYVSETTRRDLLAFDIVSPGVAGPSPGLFPGRPIASFPARQWLDSLALTADGHVCVGTLIDIPGIAMVDPATGSYTDTPFPDLLVTNICFGGADMRDAWVTLSTTGRLAKVRWDRPGLKLAHYA